MATLGRNILIGTMSGSTFTAFAAVKGHDIESQCDLIEKASSAQQQWREFVPGRKEWSLNLEYLVLQDANSNIEDLMRVGSIVTVREKGRTGNYYVQGQALVVSCRQRFQEGSLSVGNFQLKGYGPLSGHQ